MGALRNNEWKPLLRRDDGVIRQATPERRAIRGFS
jgi:hypothetical protein